jgi:cardiolipin synthase
MSDAVTKLAQKDSQRHALSLPNLLTYGRLVGVPVVAGLILWGGDAARWAALALFIGAAITDFFDGYLARRWGQQSALGRMLDPIADKVLVAVVLLVLSADKTIDDAHLWAAVIILTREVLVSGLREFLAELRVSVPVTKVAKWKTTVQLIAVGFLIAGPAGDKIVPYVSEFGLFCLWIAAALTLYTGYDYCRAGIGHVMDDK